jgi:hypothetical protein
MKILLLLILVAFILSLTRSEPDVVRKATPPPAPMPKPHVSQLPETRLQPAGKLGEKKIVY